jgi:Tfp pilus assembly protein PilN
MATRLNLASSPFRNRALPWTLTAVVTTASILLILLIAKSTVDTNAQIQSTAHEISELQKQTAAFNQRAEAIKVALTPEQQRTLKSTHSLVNRKRFSWSRLFADLGAAVPGEVRVMRIAIKGVTLQDDRPLADLDLTVASKNPTVITQMITDMERDGVFHAELKSQNLQRGKGDGGAEYELDVRYQPSAGAPAAPNAKRPVDTAGNGKQ